MKRKLILTFIITISIIMATACNKEKHINNPTSDPVKEETVEEKVDKIMKNMTIDQKIGQMFIFASSLDTINDALKSTLKTSAPGGFILMGDNIKSYEQTHKFVQDLKANSEIPLIISIDQEGGSVQRLQYFNDIKATDIPYMYNLGKIKDTSLVYDVGKIMAEELRTIGVNVDFAPVLDVYSNPNNKVIGKRSFGEDVNTVSDMALSLAKGLEDNKVIATYKHFPGHGDTATDSHVALPIIKKTYEELLETELIPFQNAIKNGAKIIMIGHIALPNITNNNTPATLSKEIITGILKEKLHYDGLVVTDALNMGALTKNYTEEEIYTKAINAGVDLLLMPKDYLKAIQIVKNNVSEERIDESVKKILIFKYTYLKDDNTLDKSYLGSIEHKQIIDKISND